MDNINAAAAARRLGISEPAVRKMISAGRLPNRARTGPALVASADVDRVMHERRTEALRRHPDTEAFARAVRAQLWPGEGVEYVTLTDGRREIADPLRARYLFSLDQGRAALAHLSPDASALFGRAAVETAATPARVFAGACRFCFADTSARVHGGLRPTGAPAFRVLLGQPCPADRARWAAEAEAGRAALARFRAQEQARRTEAERLRARTEFSTAEREARLAAERLRSATRYAATLDPQIARQAASRALRASGYSRPGDMACGCSSDRYCALHAAAFGTYDRRQARS